MTITNWKEIMDNNQLTAEEKEEKIGGYFKLIDEKKAKSLK